MTSEVSPLAITLRDAAVRRLESVETHSLPVAGGEVSVAVALPVSYGKKKRATFPLVIVLDAAGLTGSAIEMSRLMSGTGEIRESVLVCVDQPLPRDGAAALTAWLSQTLVPWCASRYRVAREDGLLVGRVNQVAGLGVTVGDAVTGGRLAVRPLAGAHNAALVASLTGQLRSFLHTGVAYGHNVTPLRYKPVMHILNALAPAFARRQAPVVTAPTPYLVHSKHLDRAFEIFVSLPRSFAPGSLRRYPALVALDATIEFSTIAETAASLAEAGEIAELIVIGIGVPRSEGAVRFGFRRFEEYFPPADGYAYHDELGRILRSLFAVIGQDARKQLGRAPDFLSFLAEELLPQLTQAFPIDGADLGLLGHSAGGTFAGYALSQARSPFRNYIAISPGVGISGSWLMRNPITPPSLGGRPLQMFASIGGLEPTNLFNRIAGIHDTEAWAARLKGLPNLAVRTRTFDDETHSSTVPRAVIAGLRALYGFASAGAAASSSPSVSACATI
jgi:predicted alpha/beta superfamily hydrolase